MADGAENRDREQGKEQKPQAQISFFVRNEAAHQAMKRRKVIDRNNEEHEAVTVSWNWRDTWQNEHKRAFVVAKMAKADLLTEVRDSLQKALDEGVPFEQWKKEIVPKLEGKWLGKSVGQLWDELSEEEKAKRTPPSEKEREKVIGSERLELIFRTNMAVANAAGHYEQLMKTKDLFPYWRYITEQDARVRDSHRPLHNKVYRWDDPFWETYFPPNGFRCRCRVRSLNKRDMERKGLHIETSNITVDEQGRKVLDAGGFYYKNNPGWDYNPGDSISHLVNLAKSNEKGRPAQVQADLEADLAKKEAEEAAAAKAKAEAEEQRKAEETRRAAEAEKQRQAAEAEKARLEAERKAKEAAAKAEAERLEAEKKAKEEERRKAEEAKKAEKARQEAEQKTQEVERRLQEARAKTEQRKAEREAKEAADKEEANHQHQEIGRRIKEAQTKIAEKGIQPSSSKRSSSISLLPTDQTESINKERRRIVGSNDSATLSIGHNQERTQPNEVKLTQEQLRKEISNGLAKCCGNDHVKATILQEAARDKIDGLSHNEQLIFLHSVNYNKARHNFLEDGAKGPGFYHETLEKTGIMIDLWNIDRNEKWLNLNGKVDLLALGHELMHVGDLIAGTPTEDGRDRLPITSLPPIKDILYNTAMQDIADFLAKTAYEFPGYNQTGAYHKYLLKYFNNEKAQVYIQTLTDVLGIYMHGHILPPKSGIFKTHSKKFFRKCRKLYKVNSDIYIEVGNSELLAGMFGAHFRDHKDMNYVMRTVFPRATSIYNDIVKLIANRL